MIEINEKDFEELKELILRLAHKYVWDEILEELADDCPNFDGCAQNAIENYEPSCNEGYI